MNSTATVTVLEVAKKYDPADPARGADAIIAFLSHRSGLTHRSVMDDNDLAMWESVLRHTDWLWWIPPTDDDWK